MILPLHRTPRSACCDSLRRGWYANVCGVIIVLSHRDITLDQAADARSVAPAAWRK